MTKIIGFLGKKQSGKNTACNFILALKLIELGVCKTVRLNDKGEIEVSDILGQTIPNCKMFPFARDIVRIEENTYMINTKALFDSHQLGKYIKIYSLAEPLKEFCIDILGLKRELVYGTDKQKNSLTDLEWDYMPGVITDKDWYEDLKEQVNDIESLLTYHASGKMTVREVLQFVGTDIFRRMNPNCWTGYLLAQIAVDQPELALVSDVRFPDETIGIRKVGGIVIHLTRDPYKKKKDQHASEKIDDSEADIILDNQKMTIPQQNKALYNALKPYKVLKDITV